MAHRLSNHMLKCISALRPEQNGRNFAEDILKCVSWTENTCKLILMALKFVPMAPLTIKLRLHGTRQAVRLQRGMQQCDLLRGNSVYMVGSCRARLLHIIHVSAVSEVGVLQEKCSRQPVRRSNYEFKLKMPPGLAAVARLLRAACRRVNAPVVFLCFYFAARLSLRIRAACRVPCKCSLSQHWFYFANMYMNHQASMS